jgi:hypothetical protein
VFVMDSTARSRADIERGVDSTVLEVSRDEPMLGDGTPIGVWAATKLATAPGDGGRSTAPATP